MTKFEIMRYVGVSEEQVNMALYSGRLPSPDKSDEWVFDGVKEILDRWKRSIDNKRERLIDEQVGNNYQSANMIIPKHTR